MKTKILHFWDTAKNKYSILLVLIVLTIVSTVINPNFLTGANLSNVSRQIAVTTILAFGETILIICGMLDLSSGSVLALSGVLSVSAFKMTGSLPLAFFVAIFVAVFCNLINALMVTRFKTPPFIATLAMLAMARGAALALYKGTEYLSDRGLYGFRSGLYRIYSDTRCIHDNPFHSHLVYTETYKVRALPVCYRRE